MAAKKLFSIVIGLVFAACAVASGASPFGSWEPSAGPPGGSLRAFVAVDTSLLAGTDHGLYRSSDGGASWRLEDLPMEQPVRALAVIDHTVLAGTFGGRLFRSDDNGAHWTPANEGLPRVPTLYIYALAVSSGSVFAAVFGDTSERIYESTDAGRSWSPRGAAPGGGINALVALGGTLYGGSNSVSPNLTTGGVYRSNDRGMTWALTSNSLANENVRVVIFSSGALIAGTDYSGIYRSLDQGMTWTAGNVQSNRSSHSVTSMIAVGSSLYAGMLGEGVFKSRDNGVTWVPTGLTGIEVRCLTSFGSAVYAGTQFGIFESDDAGDSWAGRNAGLANTYTGFRGVWTVGSDVYAHVFDFDQARITYRNSLYHSTDSGRSWTLIGGGLPSGSFDGYVDDLVSDGNALYAGIRGAGVFKSNDGGAAWFPAGPGLPVVAGWPYMLAARDGLVLVSVQNQVFRSTDAGMTWSGPGMGLSNYGFVQNMVFAGNDVYGATDQGVVKSLDQGVSWQATGLTAFTRLIAASAHALYVVVEGNSGVLKSTDGGNSWTTALRRNDIYSFAVFGGWLFAANIGNAGNAGQKDDVFFSDDEGATWTTADQNLFALGGVTLAASDRALFAGTQGNGVQTLILQPERPSIRPQLHTVGPHSVPIRR